MSAKETIPPKVLKELEKGVREAAMAGGAVLKRHYGRLLKVTEKSDGSGIVSNADVASEAAVLRKLKAVRRDFGILAEESGAAENPGGAPEGRWLVDPLDGTNNFVHGYPMFCVSVAAEWHGQLAAGAIYHPVLDEMYVAVLGRGAKVNGRTMKVSRRTGLQESLLTTGFTSQKEKWLKLELKAFEYLSSLARAVRRPGSAALDLAYTARGVFDAFWERGLAPWDVAAGSLLVSEAGGRVSGFRGEPISLDGRCEILACNPLIHSQIMGILTRRDCQLSAPQVP
ncbi:MAG TPA: inositol monophosphatase family protein [Bdellovibrionota bacterium]|jgi:myo-inositol-1(or 4)-monophosphatase|nr:inositol monophosphatase family protein [Bdellovibrionota bacterium]